MTTWMYGYTKSCVVLIRGDHENSFEWGCRRYCGWTNEKWAVAADLSDSTEYLNPPLAPAMLCDNLGRKTL